MLKKLILASALVATSAWAQQNTDISGANFQSGKADSALAALGRSAAASGNRLVITAPPEWHAKIAAKVHAGGNAEIAMRDGFYESVLVRVEDKSAKPTVVETPKAMKSDIEKSRAEAAKAKAEAEKSRADAEIAKAEAARSRAEADKAKAEAEAATARLATQAAIARKAATKPAAVPAPATPAIASTAAPASAMPDVAAVQAHMEKSLNDGHPADGHLTVAALESGDTLYVDGPVMAVTRREGRNLAMYWVDGELDLRRTELKPLATDRYQVVSTVRGEGTLRHEFNKTATALDASEPAAGAPSRAVLEKSLNDGHAITDTIAPASLRNGDVIYTEGTAAAVVRRTGGDLARYWLVGSLDLHQPGVQADGTNKYKVLTDTVH
jgi:hypothetical protein